MWFLRTRSKFWCKKRCWTEKDIQKTLWIRLNLYSCSKPSFDRSFKSLKLHFTTSKIIMKSYWIQSRFIFFILLNSVQKKRYLFFTQFKSSKMKNTKSTQICLFIMPSYTQFPFEQIDKRFHFNEWIIINSLNCLLWPSTMTKMKILLLNCCFVIFIMPNSFDQFSSIASGSSQLLIEFAAFDFIYCVYVISMMCYLLFCRVHIAHCTP